MLHNVPAIIPPDLLRDLAAMGHGDRIAIVDANFPSASRGRRVHHLPGLDATEVLRAVLALLPLDGFVPNPSATMAPVDAAADVPPAVAELNGILTDAGHPVPQTVARFDFYDLTATAFAVIQTGEARPYGNIVLTKGVIFAA